MGRLVFQTQCARCHGPEGHGDGPDAVGLVPPPRDFASTSWRTDPSPDTIRRITTEGIPGTAMTGFGRTLSRAELDALTAHVSGLAPKTGFRPVGSNQLVPDFEMIGLDGARHRLDDHRGRVVLLTFWGTTCAPCLAEMPSLEALSDTYRDRGLDVLLVCVDETDLPGVARAVEGRLKRLAPLIDAGMGRVRHDVQSTPTTLLIGRDGRPLARAEGTRDWNGPADRALIEAALAGSS